MKAAPFRRAGRFSLDPPAECVEFLARTEGTCNRNDIAERVVLPPRILVKERETLGNDVYQRDANAQLKRLRAP
jgi:hypothetical protein